MLLASIADGDDFIAGFSRFLVAPDVKRTDGGRLFHDHHIGSWCCRSLGTSNHNSVVVPEQYRSHIGGYHATVEVAIGEGGNPQRLVVLGTAQSDAAPGAPLPGSAGLRQIGGWGERPVVLFDGIQTLVVEHSHETGVGSCAVGFLNGESPFLLLTRRQSVAECLPLQLQLFVGHGTLDELAVTIALAVLDPCKSQ